MGLASALSSSKCRFGGCKFRDGAQHVPMRIAQNQQKLEEIPSREVVEQRFRTQSVLIQALRKDVDKLSEKVDDSTDKIFKAMRK